MIINKKTWKVGELAYQTGLTVRTLHHYDRIGLLSPSRHSESGHRAYIESDISKLQQIVSLKQLGFALEEIKGFIENPRFNPVEVLRIQLEREKENLRIQEQLCNRLEEIYGLLNSKQDVKVEDFIKLIEVMNMQQYFTQEQLEKMKELGKQSQLLDPEKKKMLEQEWSELITKVRVELEKGTPPTNPDVVQLAKRWKELLNTFTGGDPGITQSAERYYQENPDRAMQTGIDRELYLYIKQAF